MYEIGSRPRLGDARFWLVGLPVFAAFAAFGSVVWVAYVDSAPGSAVGEPPLIKADVSPIKLSPDDPGGRVVADQGEVRQLLSDEATPQRERLLPLPEEPLAPLKEAETVALGETSKQPPAEAADQSQGVERQALEPSGGDAPATGQEPAATTTPERSTPAGQSASEPSAASGSPSNGAEVGAPPELSPATQDAEAALEALLAEVMGAQEDGPSTPSPDQTGNQAMRPDGSDVAPSAGSLTAPQEQTSSSGASAGTGGTARNDVAGTSPGTGASASQGEGQTATPGRVPVEPMPSQTQVASSGPTYRIQLAAVRDEANARRAWDLFQLDLGDVLAGLDPVIERAETANGVFYRVQVGEFASLGNAEALCDRLKQRDASCFVIRR